VDEIAHANKVIAQVHCLATAAEKCDDIAFTEIYGNIIFDQLTEDTYDEWNTGSGITNNQQPNNMKPDVVIEGETGEYN